MNKSRKAPEKRKNIIKYNFNFRVKNKTKIIPKIPVDTRILISNES